MGVMRAFMWVLYTNLYVSYKGAVMGVHMCMVYNWNLCRMHIARYIRASRNTHTTVWVLLLALIYLAICILHRFQFNCIGNINDVSKQI